MPKYLAIILNNSASNTPVYSLGVMTLMVLTALLMMAGGIGGAYFGAKASVNFAADLRIDIYKKVQTFSSANIDKFSTGSLVTRLTNDVSQMQNFINTLLRVCLRAPGMMIGSLIMVIILRPSLAFVFAIAIPIMIIFVLFIIFQGLPRFTRMQGKIDNLNNTIKENITNSRVVKSFVRNKFEIEKFAHVNNDLKDAGMSAMGIMILLQPVMTLVLNFTIVAVLWFGGGMVLAEKYAMPIGDLSAFISYCNQILMSLMMITMVIVMSSRSLASSRRIREVLDEETDVNDSKANKKTLKVKNGNIEFRNVSFRYYKNSKEKVLDSLNLNIEQGSTIGIIGSTGSGKTTLVSLITRLYDPDQGQIMIDGVNVKDYSLENLRNGVGIVLQKNILFSGSIEDNLRWGNENATFEEIKSVAKYAQADKFISTFDEGYQTNLDQGGINISGGQKQRLCIARALLKRPKILIFDDSTSAVDTATESQIRASFKKELANSTKIIIAQRISSVQEANKIFVLNEGKIVGRGSHTELMETCAEYREIYYSQVERKEDESHA
jgi:ATP-binding cassette subfamily B protein